jgi:hypothetical protein
MVRAYGSASNNGNGIPQIVIDKIFQAIFYNKTNRQWNGLRFELKL